MRRQLFSRAWLAAALLAAPACITLEDLPVPKDGGEDTPAEEPGSVVTEDPEPPRRGRPDESVPPDIEVEEDAGDEMGTTPPVPVIDAGAIDSGNKPAPEVDSGSVRNDGSV